MEPAAEPEPSTPESEAGAEPEPDSKPKKLREEVEPEPKSGSVSLQAGASLVLALLVNIAAAFWDDKKLFFYWYLIDFFGPNIAFSERVLVHSEMELETISE